MILRRRGSLITALWVLALLAALLPAAPARAAGPNLQVTREVNTVLGGDAPTLTAQLPTGTGRASINFEVLGGPGDPDNGDAGGPDETCDIQGGATTCVVAIRGNEQGTSLVRAWVDGVQPDKGEGRLADDGAVPVNVLDPAADCQMEDDELLQNTCRSGATVDAGDQAEPDATDVVQITWSSFADARLDCDDAKPSDGEDTEYNNAGSNDRSETYTCTLATLAGQPITNAFIDGERIDADGSSTASLDKPRNASGADLDEFCRVQAGRCTGTVTVSGTGDATMCFWAEPVNANDPNAGEDSAFNTTDNTDGKGCEDELVGETEANDITDSVLLDTDNPRASSLDARPETQSGGPGDRFTISALVYDQFGGVFQAAGTKVLGELFEGSPLDRDGNTPSTPDLQCETDAAGGCSKTLDPQEPLGANLACLWLDVPGQAPADDKFIGDNLDGSCEDEVPTDPTADEGTPAPVADGRDIVRFTVQSRPVILSVSPNAKRPETTDVLAVTGASFVDGAKLAVTGPGVRLGPTSFVSGNRLEAELVVASDAPAGNRDVTVTNPDGGTATCAGCFHVIGQGYWLASSDGGVFGFGDAEFFGSPGGAPLNKPIVGMATTPTGQGYWLVASDGGIFAYGDAAYFGSAGDRPLNKPIIGIAALPTGRGYWLVASDGGIFSYGDARFYGSTGRLPLSRPIVGIAATPTGRGYWLVGSDGGIFAFGDARFHGGTGDLRLNKPIVAMAPTSTGKGYWLVGSDGGIFAYGDAFHYGGTGDIPLNHPIVSMVTTPDVKGYWLVASDGGIFAFGDARFHGSTAGTRLNRPIVAIARR